MTTSSVQRTEEGMIWLEKMVEDILMESNDQKSKDERNFGSTRIQQIPGVF